ncbi:MAG: hypothetical protein AAF203_03835 [Pseudomonadota bacterium]
MRGWGFLLCLFLLPAQASGSQSRFNYDRTEDARKVSHFWEKRKMGIGVAMAGAYGLVGGVVGIHFHPQWSVDLGFGGGSHFQSYGFRVKKMLLLSSPLNPYIGLGFNRWHRSTTRPMNADSVSPGFVNGQFLSDEDRRTGNIDEKLIHGSLGIQYVFTEGEWEGYGFYLEALLLVSAVDRDSAPTGSIGLNYFF